MPEVSSKSVSLRMFFTFGLKGEGEGYTRKITHARIILKADASQPDRWTGKAIGMVELNYIDGISSETVNCVIFKRES